MKQKVFCVRDAKVEAYLKPFFVRTLGEAERAFTDMANNQDTQIGKYPTDFALYYLGVYDDESGKFGTGEPQHCMNAVDCVSGSNVLPFDSVGGTD